LAEKLPPTEASRISIRLPLQPARAYYRANCTMNSTGSDVDEIQSAVSPTVMWTTFPAAGENSLSIDSVV
jgi:hypothetical protein